MLLYLLVCFCVDKMYDDVKNVQSYSSINLLLAIQLLLPSSDSKDFVDRPTKRKLSEVLAEFKTIEDELGIKEVVMEALKLKKIPRANVLRYGNNKEREKLSKERVNAFIKSKKNEDEDEIEDNKKKEKEESIFKLDILGGSGDLIKNYLNDEDVEDADDEDTILHGMDKTEKIHILTNFVEKNFHPVGYDIQEHEPEDFTATPKFIKGLENRNLINMSNALQNTWRELSRVARVIPNEGATTLLQLPRPFIIPGGRFREFYYWDTYWILEGLLVSDMHKSAENIIINFISIINEYGYIPNGTRKYYLYRSEPPFFTMMLLKLLDIENGKYNELVFGKGLEAALKEYEFWRINRTIEVSKNAKTYKLNMYRVHSNFPRLESFAEDVMTYERQKERSEEQMYTNIKSGAESGWDFSSRWFDNSTDMGTVRAVKQIPVDLNAILYRNEVILYTLLSRKGEKPLAKKFLKLSEERAIAINTILWNSTEGSWMDYLYEKDDHVDSRFYFSNIMPMIYGIPAPEGKTIYDIMKKYALELFGYKGGIPVSGKGLPTIQQWDYPNVWAPHQHMMVEFLLNAQEEDLAFHVAKAFFNSVYAGFKISKAFFEKYNCNHLGRTGGGGEYAPQTGFGWTNGAILSFILKFKDRLIADYDFESKLTLILKELQKKTTIQSLDDVEDSSIPVVSNVIINIKT